MSLCMDCYYGKCARHAYAGMQSSDSPTLPKAWQGIPRPALSPDEAKALFKTYNQSTRRRRLRAWLTRNFGL